MKNLFSFLLVTCVLSANGAQADGLNLPEVSNPTTAGRIMAFPSVKGVTWFLASGLSSALDCSPGVLNRVCTIRIFNTVTEKEEAALKALTPSWAQYDGFRDFNTNIVVTVDERFESLIGPMASGRTMFLKTLGVSSQVPYASIVGRMPSAGAESLASAYETDGVGEFISEVQIRGEMTETYLAIREITALQELLKRSTSAGGVKGSVLKAAIKDALNQTSLVHQGLELEEAQVLAYEYILRTFFKLGARSRYQVRADRLSALQEGLVVVDETYAPTTLRCKVVLPLRKNAVSSVSCKEDA